MQALSDLVGSLTHVLSGRLRGRRRHPDWSLPFEVGVELCGRQVAPERIIQNGVRQPQGATPIPPGLRRRLRFERGSLAGLATEEHTPLDWSPSSGQVLLYIHGGGYFACSPGTHRALISRIAHTGQIRCVAPDYRLAPEHPFPAAIDDCLAAYQALLDSGLPASRIFIGGDSAGGGLTLAVLQRLRAAGGELPRAALLLSPWVDLQAEGGSMDGNAAYDYLPGGPLGDIVHSYVGEQAIDDPLISPIHADLHGLPPMLVLTGALEIFHDQNRAFAARAVSHGVDLQHHVEPGMVHVYPLLADVSKPARRAFHQMAQFFRDHA